jgi:hypothetical protein
VQCTGGVLAVTATAGGERPWKESHTGTVVRIDGASVFLAWHGTCVEGELDAAQVEVLAEAPERLRHGRGEIGTVGDGGHVRARPLTDQP